MGRLKCLLLKLIFFELAWADCPRPIIHTDIVSEDCPNGRNTFGCKYTLACQLGYLPSFPDRYPNMIGSFSCGEDGNWHDDKGVEVAITDADPNMLACIPGCLYPAPNETSLYVVEAPPSEIYTFPDRKNNNQPMQWIYGGINFTLRCTGDHVVLQKTMTSDIMLADYTCIQRPNVNNPYFYSSSITNGENILNNCQKSCLFNADNKQGSVEEISGTRAWRDGGILNFNCIQNTAFKAGSSAFGREYERLRCDAKNNHLIDTFSEMAVTQSPCVQNLIPGQCFWPAIDNVEVISTTCQNTTVGVKAECTMSLRCKQGFRPTNLKFLTPTGSEAITCKDGQGWVDETGQQAAFIQCEQGCIREVLTVGDLESISHNLPISNGSLFSATCRNLTIYKKPLPDHPYYCLDLGNTGSCSMSCRSPQPLPSGVVIVNKNDNHTFLWAASPFNMWIFANGTAIYKCEEGYYYPEDSSPAQHGQTQRVHCDWDSVMTDPDTGVANPTLVACVPITGCRIIDPGWSANITNETSSCVRDDVKREYNNGCTLKYDCNAGTYPNEAQYVAANGQEITCKSGKWFNILGEVVTKSLACQHGCASFNLPDYIRTMVSNSTGLKVLSVNYTDTAGAVHSSTLTLAFAEVLNRTQIGQNRYYCSFVNTSIILAAEIARALSCKDSCLTVDLTTAPTNPNLITMPANFTTELNQTYVGINGTYEFECPAGKVVPGQESGYKQKLICGPDSFFINPDTNEVIKTRNLTGLKACTETDVCSLPNKTSTNNVISTDCQIVTIPKTGLKYNCTVNITCLPGYFPVTTTVGSFDIIQVVCGKPTNVTGSRWIDIKTGEELSLNCTPGVCPAPVNSTSVSVTSNCVITNGAVTNNCTVMEQCKEGFFSVDSTGMTGSTRSSFCDTTKLNNSTLTNIVIGTVLPPLNCTEKAQCEIPKTTATTTTNSTTCIIANGKVNYGCTVTEQCLKGYYPVNSRGVVNNVRTYNCTAFDDKNSILIDITTGEILPSLNCTKPCANLILPVGTTLTSSCVVQKNGYTVGCNASLVCDNGLQVNISGRITTVRNVRCDKIDDTNSTFIDILTGQPVDLSPCVCPVNIPNSTIIKSDCIRVGQGGPPGCSIDKTCAPGTAPIWTENRLPTNISLVCGKPNGTNNYAWIEIKTGEASQLDDCHEVCPAVTVANAHVTTTCTLLDGDYQIGCTATVECDQGFQGINSKYNFASKLNITCKGVASNNSTFIEITTGEPLLREICGTPPQAPLVCKLINTTNVRTDSTCYIAGAGAPLGCQANVTCIPGTIPVYTNETVSSSVTVYYCNGTADRNNKSWIEITSGAPLEDKSCWPPCPEVTLPGTKFNTSCTLLNGGFQVGCNATLICDEDYFPINTTSGTNLVANLVCKSHNNTASTWTNIMTGEPVREGPCIKPECGLLNNTNTVVGSSCYYAGKGAALDCVANVTCIPGMYPVYTTSGFNTTDHLKCEKKKGQVNATWIRITTGEVVKGDECQSSCPNVIYPATKFNSSCGTLKDGGFQVGCNATLVCEETYLPIDTESGTNPVTNIVCKKLNTTTSVWVKITTGEPATKPPCEVTATTPKPTTLKPPEKCTWNNFEQLTQYSAQCSDPTDAMTIPPIMYAYCNMSYACTNNSVSATYNYRVNMTVFCNKNSSTDAGTWIEVQTGQQLKTLNCTRVCRELVPPVGTKQISQTCAQAALYNLACKKDFSCIEETAPGSGTPPKNTAICRTVDGEARWVDSTTNAAYVGLSGCPSPKTGCLPIDHSNTTRVVNASCTPFPSGIHPENCKIDVECLAELRPVDLNDKENGEHVAECLKNNGTGNYEWFERTKGQWYIKHDCTKNCILNPSNTASNTTVIYPNGTTRVCNFNSVIPGTGKYYCGGKDIINVTCNLTCQLLKISGSLVFGSKPELIKESVVPIGGQYEIYCSNGYVWKGTTNTSKKYTCGADGKYTFGQETGVSIVVDLCEKPTTSKANCTLNLTDGHEVESSSCDTEDLIYAGGCLVTVQCKNGTYPNPKETPCQQRLCDPVSRQFVDPVTKGALKPYSCDQGYEAIKSCKDTIAPEGTQDYNYTCGPINLFGDNCMVSFKCKLGYYPKLVTDRKLLNRTAKCTYPRWIDILDGLEFKMFECIKGCLSDTSSLLQSTVQTREITQAGKTLKCNVTTYLGDERLYYCKAIDYASVSCPQTCPQLMVRSPLVTLVTPLNYVLNKVVLGGDKYIVSCPPGHIIEDRTIPDASSRPYICDSISGKYVNDFDEQVQEANFVCIPAGTGTCTLPQQPETITATSSCPTTTGSYVISCVVFLSCPTGSAPEQPDDQLFRQRVIQCQNKTGSGVNWIDLNSGLVAFKPYTCKAGCLQAEQTQTISSFLVGNTPTTCNISTIPVEAIQWQCPSSPALPDGTTKHDCSSGCRELQYKGQYFYVDVPSVYYHYVMFDSSYTFFCPPGAYFNNTEVYYQIFTCQKDGTYINPIGLPLSTLDAGCTEIPQGGLGQKQENVTITGRDGISEDPFIGISVVTSSLITPITPLPIIGDEAAATEDHAVPGEQAPEPVGELTVKPPTTSGCTLGRSQP